jgi:uncharacterized protein
MRSSRIILAAIVATALALPACGGERQDASSGEGGRLSIATGNTTGVYYQMGGGLARLIGQNLSGYTATAEATGASVENIRRVVNGDSDIAFTLADTAGDAAQGKGSFDSPQPIRALARIYTNYTQVLVRADAGITSVEQMKGKTVSTGSPNSGTEVIAERLLTAAGVDPAAGIKRQKLTLPETVQGVKDGTIQAMFWSGGLPTAGVTDLVTSLKGQVRFLDLTPYLSKLQSEYGDVYQSATIAPAVYKQSAPVKTIGVPNMLVVNDSMSDDLAFKLTELLFTKQAELAKVHPEAKNIKRDLATQTEPVQLHPGSQRYFDGT